jgi:hypothetical protein
MMITQINSGIHQPFAKLSPSAQDIGGVPYTKTELKYCWVVFSNPLGHTPQYLCGDGAYRETPSGHGESHGYYKSLDEAEDVWLKYQDEHVAKKLATG